MCGITGFIAKQGFTEVSIQAMTGTLRHRGPNSQGTWQAPESGIALGHTRLAIHDLDNHANQPMVSENQRYVMVFNGEIYNFIELRLQLEKEGIPFHTNSDTEVLLAFCAHKGLHETLQRISGMFAFALWDKNEKTLFLVRDRIGKKPLYYARMENNFIFGSELKALVQHPHFKKVLSREAANAYFEYGNLAGHYSIYENTFKLSPGHYLSVNQNLDLNIEQYSHIETQAIQTDDILVETKNRLEAAVKTRMSSDVPLGAFLSGGIDSSLITALMQKESKNPIHTFSIGFENNEFDESVYAENIAHHLGTRHQTFIVTEAEAQAVIPSLTEMFDEPFADSSAIPSYLLAKLARSQVTVALTGDGGDEVFGGYNRYRYAKILKKLAWLPLPLRSIMASSITSQSAQNLLKKTLFKNMPQFQQKAQKLAAALSFKNEQACYDNIVKIFANTPGTPAGVNATKKDWVSLWQYRDLIGYLCDDVLTKVDRATMAVGLEARSPFLDEKVVNWGLSLPLHYKIKGSETKWILRQILKTYVPESFFDRPKQGFALPISPWLKGSLKPWAEHLLFEVKEDWQIISADTIKTLWQAHQSNQMDASQKLWTLLMWRAFISKRA